MTKILKKAMMTRSQLANKFMKTKSDFDLKNFKKQKNYVNRLYKREKKNFFKNISAKSILDNKKFWKVVKPLFSDKFQNDSEIKIVNGNSIISNDRQIAKEFSSFFHDSVNNLNIPSVQFVELENSANSIEEIVNKYKKHPSIVKIKDKVGSVLSEQKFKFDAVSISNVMSEIDYLDTNKSVPFGSIPGKIVKKCKHLISKKVTELFNQHINTSICPKSMKLADIHPIFKSGNKSFVKNYRPISILSYSSKIFKKILQKQINEFIEQHLSKNLCGYRKGFNSQHALISMIENWRQILDKKGFAGAVLMDLSKAFDCIDHKLLVAKLEAYGFGKMSLELIYDYLSKRYQRVNIKSNLSPWSELLMGVPQGSVLGPLLFNIYLNDLFWFIEGDVCNFADDTTLYGCNDSLDLLIKSLEKDSQIAIGWFRNNNMKLNTDKCKFIVAGKKSCAVTIKVGDSIIKEQETVRLLGVTVDNKLSFNDHLEEKLTKANSKLLTLRRNKSYFSFHQLKIVLSSFINSQLSYSPLVWMFHTREFEKRINNVHKKALRILYNQPEMELNELLELDRGITNHMHNIHLLVIEMFKAKNKIGPSLLSDIFSPSDYTGPNLRSSKFFKRTKIVSSKFGLNSLRDLGIKLWNLLPKKIQDLELLGEFKKAIATWKPKCPCQLCRTYITDLGFVSIVFS